MARWEPANVTMPEKSAEDWAEILNQPTDKGGRPEGAKDKTHSGRRNRPRNTSKSEVVVMAADWHVAKGINDIGQTVAKFFPIYSQGMTEDDRYFRSRLIAEISKRSQ